MNSLPVFPVHLVFMMSCTLPKLRLQYESFYTMQLYLCGVVGKRLEKLRRLVNSAGGLRFNQLGEELTHIVMGEPDQDVKSFLAKASHRSV